MDLACFPSLLEEHRFVPGIALRTHHLDGDFPAGHVLLGPEDDTHAAYPHQIKEFVFSKTVLAGDGKAKDFAQHGFEIGSAPEVFEVTSK
jgi:hypothetical protein